MAGINEMRPGDFVKYQGRREKIASIWGVNADGTLEPPSRGGFGVVTESGIRVGMFEAESYHKNEEQRYTADHPNLDWDKLHEACLYALQQLRVADQKELDSVPMSAEEHRSMAYRKLREAMKEI